VAGYVASDTVTLAGLPIEEQRFGMVTSAQNMQVWSLAAEVTWGRVQDCASVASLAAHGARQVTWCAYRSRAL
jgi:hypothetical protein